MSSRAAAASEHVTDLEQAYREVGERTWRERDFLESNLEVSRTLYTPESLVERRPRPKALEVFGLLSGLPFEAEFAARLVTVQRHISGLLGNRLHYWVAPANLGVEYCVFKWPTDPWRQEWMGVIRDVLATIRRPAFRFSIGGIQINPDGCVVAKGFDEGGALFEIRERMRAGIPFLPKRQSGWAHVPLGRILEPVGAAKFAELASLIRTMAGRTVASTSIDSLKLVHETRWYMEEKAILSEYALGDTLQRSCS